MAIAVGLWTRSNAPASSAASPSSLSASLVVTAMTRGASGDGAQGREDAEAVELGHDQVERHHVGLELGDLLERVEAVVGDPHHLETRVGAQHLAHHLAREGRVVHHEHPHARLGHLRTCASALAGRR